MMVVHEDNERPVEVSVIRKPLLEQKSYVIVKNHVRELPNTAQNTSTTNTNEDKSQQNSENVDTKRKKRKSNKKNDEMPTTSFTSDVISRSSEIDPIDLEELKSVYKKCKEVITRIESKYGHLLDLDGEMGHSSKGEKRKSYTETSEDECQCQSKKKILFDDEGRQITVDSLLENHICAKKVINAPNVMQTGSRNIEVEYNDAKITLPDDLNELKELLQDRKLEKTYRNTILEKIKTIKQEYVNELRFNRHILIEQLKSNPDDVLNFKGTNLSSIPGYS